MKNYRSKDGDMIDKICHDYYGSISPLAELMTANPSIADYGPVLPSGVVINLPAVVTPAQETVVRLWD